MAGVSEKVLVPLPTAKSSVWKYFGFEADTNQKIITKKFIYCKLCPKPLAPIPYSSNTSNLTYHLSKHHPDEHAKVSGASKVSHQDKEKCVSTSHQEMIHESFSKITPHAKDSNKMKRVISATGDFIVQSLQPISIVDDTSFRNLLATADRKIDLPHRTHFSTKVIPEKYVAIRSKVEKQLSGVEYCTITSDLWTASYQNRSYISLTAHFVDSEFSLKSFCLDTIEVVQDHSAQSICDVLSTMFQSWNISHNVFCATTDNAANIVNAASLLGIEHFPCFAHTLQLSVKKALDVQNVRNTIARCKKLV